MKTVTKILLGVGAIAGAYVGYRVIKNLYLESKKEAEEQMEREERKLNQAGLRKPQTKEEAIAMAKATVVSNKPAEPITKCMYGLLLKSSNWDKDDINGERKIFGPSDDAPQEEIEAWEKEGMGNTIHVLEEKPQGKGRQGYIHFYIQVPPYLRKTPLPKEYLLAVREAAHDFWIENHFQFREPKVRFKGFYSVVGDERIPCSDGTHGLPEVYYEIPEEDYKGLEKDGRHDGLARLISHYYMDNGERLEESDYESVNMYVDVSFPIKNERRDGVDTITAIGFLKKLIDLDIVGEGSTQRLGPVIFHAQGDLGIIYSETLTERYVLFDDPEDESIEETESAEA
jgi:hypothetical protein